MQGKNVIAVMLVATVVIAVVTFGLYLGTRNLDYVPPTPTPSAAMQVAPLQSLQS